MSFVGSVATLGEVGAIASSSAPVGERLRDTVEVIRSVVPYVAVHVGHRGDNGMRTIIGDGYPDRTRNRLESTCWLREATEVLARNGHDARSLAFRQCDLTDPEANETVAEYLRPAGFQEGITCMLRSSRGELTGVVNLSVETADAASDEARAVIEAAGGVLSNLINEYALGQRDLATFLVDDVGFVRFHSGPDRFNQPDVKAEVMAQLARLGSRTWAMSRIGNGDGARLVTVAPMSHFGGQATKAVITVGEAPDMPLTEREVEVVRFVAQGCSNPEIAARLGIGRRTVATHIEHILIRLGLTNRTEIAVWASRVGVLASP